MVYRALKEYRIARRSNECRSKLRTYKLITLEDGIQEKGLRGFAAEFAVHENKIRHYFIGLLDLPPNIGTGDMLEFSFQ